MSNPKEVPRGELLSAIDGELPLDAVEQQDMALLLVNKTKALLVIAEDMYGNTRTLSQRQRARRKLEGVDVDWLLATREVIRIIYSRHSAAQQNDRFNQANLSEPQKLAGEILQRAVQLGASDLHIEARESHAELLVRVNGSRRRLDSNGTISFEAAQSVARVLYNIHADSATTESGWNPVMPQDAVIEYETPDDKTPVQLRFSSGPLYKGFHVVIRLLKMNQQSKLMSLEKMGYSLRQVSEIEGMQEGSRGLVLLTGPTNSGKSTSMQAQIARVYRQRGDTIKIITVEDPVEYLIPGACQMGVPPRKRGTAAENQSAFTALLKGTLRQDADLVMVGEIRDAESANVVKDLVLTGRKVFSTLHVFSVFQSFVRLREIGVPWDVLVTPGFISGIIFQRLVPTLCPECSVPLADAVKLLNPDLVGRLESVADVSVDPLRVMGEGCSHCNGSGHVGRVACAEVLIPDAKILEYLKAGDVLSAERYWMRRGSYGASAGGPKYPTALAHAIAMMRRGLLDPRDVEHNIDVLTADDRFLSVDVDAGQATSAWALMEERAARSHRLDDPDAWDRPRG